MLVLLGARPSGAQDVTSAPAETRASAGALVVPAGTVREGGVSLVTGDLDVRGTVRGDVLLGTGDLTVAPGGRVTGTARSLFGRVRADGGRVDGGLRDGLTALWRHDPAPARPYDTWTAVRATLAWFGVLLVLGLGLLAGAGTQLDAVATSLEGAPGRALLAGLAGQLALAPALALLVTALALTVVGVLAVPLAVVLFVLAAAGLLTLGFLASAFVLGRWAGGGRRAAAGRPRATAVRAESLRALGLGLGLVLVVWTAAALLGGGAAGLLLRAAAVALTWVAVTAGFGAALRSRAGTRTGRLSAALAADRGGVPAWQTPTPVAGVVAARRPTMPGAARPTAGAGTE
jgi:hypothetical protein